MNKKLLSLLLVVAMLCVVFTGCGGTKEASVAAKDSISVSETTEETENTKGQAPETQEASLEESAVEPEAKVITHLVEFPIENAFTVTVSESTTPSLTGSGLVGADGQGLGWAKWLSDRTGADIQVDLYSFFDSADKQNLMIASGDYADLIMGSLSYASGVDGAVEDEVLCNILDYSEYIPDYLNALYSDVDTLAGALSTEYNLTAFYGINDPNATADYGPVIRQDWLKEQGLQVPVTYDDYHNVLKVFKEQYGATLWITAYGGVPGDFSGGYGLAEYSGGMASPFYVEDGEYKMSAVDDGFQDYVRMMHQWYEEGLIYPDFLSQGSIDHPDSALINNGDVGIWFTYVAYLESEQASLEASVSGGDVQALAYPLMNEGDKNYFGKGAANGGVDGMGGFSVTTASEDIPLLCAIMNEFYTEDGYNFCNWGTEGETYVMNADGSHSFTDLIVNDEYGLGSAVMMTYYFFKDGPFCYNYDRYLAAYSDRQLNACEKWTTDKPAQMLYSMTTEQSSEYYGYNTDVITVYQEYLVKFIAGDKDIDMDWQEFMDKMYSCGLQEMLDLGATGVAQYADRLSHVQELYDEYHAA